MSVKTKKATEKKTNKIKVVRAHQFDDDSIAIDLEVNGVSIYNATLREGKYGHFVSFPYRKGKDGKFYSLVYVKFSEDDIQTIIEQVEEL